MIEQFQEYSCIKCGTKFLTWPTYYKLGDNRCIKCIPWTKPEPYVSQQREVSTVRLELEEPEFQI